jgi:hypothetical protein
LWIGEQLSPVEILCIRSFLQHGHTFNLWAYQPITNLPDGTTLMDANLVIPFGSVFSYNNTNKFGHGKGSYAGFSDIFRYRLLYLYGGWWTDMDITCLKPMKINEEYVFRLNGDKGVVGNLMKCPAGSLLMKYCYDRAIHEIGPENRDWLLPIRILNQGIRQFEMEPYCRVLTNPDSWPLVCRYVIGQPKVPDKWYALHWMNEEWRRCELDKFTFVRNSMIEKLLLEFEVGHRTYLKKESFRIRLKLGRLNYLRISLVASVKWWAQFLFYGKSRSE